MATNKYCVVDTSANNVIVNIVLVEDSDKNQIEEESGMTLVLDNDNIFSNVGGQYVNGYFQPVDPESVNASTWTLGEDGVWDAIKDMPDSPNTLWNPISNEWTILDPESADFESLMVEIGELFPNG